MKIQDTMTLQIVQQTKINIIATNLFFQIMRKNCLIKVSQIRTTQKQDGQKREMGKKLYTIDFKVTLTAQLHFIGMALQME